MKRITVFLLTLIMTFTLVAPQAFTLADEIQMPTVNTEISTPGISLTTETAQPEAVNGSTTASDETTTPSETPTNAEGTVSNPDETTANPEESTTTPDTPGAPEESTEEQTYHYDEVPVNQDYAITYVNSEKNNITVSWTAPKEVVIKVTVIDEKDATKSYTQTANTNAEAKGNATLNFETLPEFYIIEVVLLDADGNELCTKFIEKRYTKDIQKLAKAKLTDYESDLTVPLFTNDEGFTSFVVMQKGAKVLYSDTHKFTIRENYDQDTSTNDFFLESEGDTLTSLGQIEAGDVVALVNTTGRSFYTGPLTELDPVTKMPVTNGGSYYDFNFIKVTNVTKTVNGIHLVAMDDAAATPDLLYQQVVIKTGASKKGGTNVDRHCSFGNESIGISGEFDLKMDVSFELYFDVSWTSGLDAYFSIKDDYRLENFTVRIAGSKGFSFPIFEVPIGIPEIADIAFKVKLEAEISGNGNVNFNVIGTTGVRIGSGSDNLSTDPSFELNSINLEGSVSLGIGVGIFGDILTFEAGGELLNAFEFSGKLSAKEEGSSTTPWHVCENFKCLQGEICYKFSAVASIDLKIIELSKSFDFVKKKLTDFYWSFTFDTHAFTECPYKGYQLVVNVKDQNKKPVKDADISYAPLDDKFAKKATGKTDDNGQVILYVPADEEKQLTVTASKTYTNDYSTASKVIKKKEESETIDLQLDIVEYYYVNYNSNKPANASNPMRNEMGRAKYPYNEERHIDKNKYYLPGWLFAGWNTKADGTGTAYTDEQQIMNLTTPGCETTLYAQWVPKEYTLTYRYRYNGNDFTKRVLERYDYPVSLYDYHQGETDVLLIWKHAGYLGSPDYYTTETYTNLCDYDNITGAITGWTFDAFEYSVSDADVVMTADYKPYPGFASHLGLYNEASGTTFKGNDLFTEYSDRPGHYKVKETFERGHYEILIEAEGQMQHTGKYLDIDEKAEYQNLHYYSVSVSDDQDKDATVWTRNVATAPGPESNLLPFHALIDINVDQSKFDVGTTFDEWENQYSCPDDFDPSLSEQTVSISGKTILEATTRKIRYHVAFHANKPEQSDIDPLGQMQALPLEYDTPCALTPNAFSIPGWTFTGWNTEADGSDDAYADGDEVVNLCDLDGDIVDLFAQWEPDEYQFIEGMNAVWTKGTKSSLTFKTNGLLQVFEKLLIDGKEVDPTNYSVKSGSTIITLKAAYLEKLIKGKHTITAVYKNGSAPSTKFSVKAAKKDPNKKDPNKKDPNKNPKTGDSSMLYLTLIILLLAAASFAMMVVTRRRRQ